MAVVLGGLGTWQILEDRLAAGLALGAAGAVFLLCGVFAPGWLVPFHRVWTRFAFALGYVNTRILLTLFFFLILTPTGVVRRMLGRDGLARRLDPSAGTGWNEKTNGKASRASYERQY